MTEHGTPSVRAIRSRETRPSIAESPELGRSLRLHADAPNGILLQPIEEMTMAPILVACAVIVAMAIAVACSAWAAPTRPAPPTAAQTHAITNGAVAKLSTNQVQKLLSALAQRPAPEPKRLYGA